MLTPSSSGTGLIEPGVTVNGTAVFCDSRVLDLPVPGEDIDYDGDLTPIIEAWTERYAATEDVHDAERFERETPAEFRREARGIEFALPVQFFGKRDGIDHSPALGDAEHRAEQAAVLFGVERVVLDEFDRAQDRGLVDQHRREHRNLGVFRIWRTTIAVRINSREAGRYRVFDGRAGHLPR